MDTKLDFSKFSKVQDSLKERLLAKYDERQRLQDDELDMVAAAVGVSRPSKQSETLL